MPRYAVLTAVNSPLELRTCQPAPLRYGQVRVQILLTGICGAQLQEIRGEKAAEYIPHMLGHEACGRVLEVGEGVTTVKVGDKVCCHWRKGAGADVSGGSYYCEGGGVTSGPIHTFCEEAVLSENRVTAVPEDTPDELVALLGCALSTALGLCENEAKLKMGESVLVVGCGGVGLCCIAAAKAMGAAYVNGADLKPEFSFMGVYIYNWDMVDDMACVAHWDCIMDTTGNPDVISDCSGYLNPSGRLILIGQPSKGSSFNVPNAHHLFDGSKRIIASNGGCFKPAQDIPRYIAAWRSGVFKYEGIVTHTFSLDQINEAIETLKSGQAGRIMIKP